MEELSWRAKLAKSNINILQVTPDYWVVEFTYHPKPNPAVFKWCKTVFPHTPSTLPEELLEEVLSLRKELEG